MSATERLPNEILLEILSDITLGERIFVDAMNERPLNVKRTSLYTVSQVCQRWRSLSGYLPGWQRVVLDHVDVQGPKLQKVKSWREEYGVVLRRVLEIARSTGRSLEVKCDFVDQWPDDGRTMLESRALSRLVQADISWKAFEYVHTPFTSLDWACNTLAFVRSKFGGWEYFGMDMDDGPIEDETHSVADLAELMAEMSNLRRLSLRMGYRGDWHWHSNNAWSFPSLTISALRVRVTGAVGVVLLKMCPQVKNAVIWVEGKDTRKAGEEENPPDDGSVFSATDLKTLMLVILDDRVTFTQILTRMRCPRLEQLVFEWPRKLEAELIECGASALRAFIERPREGSLTGEVYFPYARKSKMGLGYIEDHGLKRLRAAPREYWLDQWGEPLFLE
ncbi:hypothetical protein AAF712_005544 [Marasmius tenuissimus]|uniref:F-box domain-containing protein n=1 Tax=Marasmius tenuissimus TaxID=585030 RepID=A0ABR3A115_9AGAR